MKRFKGMVAAVLVLLAVAVLLTSGHQAFADSAALSITPKKNYVINPGQSVDDTLTISNLDSSQPLDLSMRVIDFTYNGLDGTPKLFLDPNAPQTTWSLKPYLTVPDSVTIPAGGSKTVKMHIAIPSNVGAGSYYSAIIYSAGAPNGGNIGLSASGATLAFVSVPGQVKEKLSLEQFGGYKTISQSVNPGYVSVATTTEPWNIAYTLKNSGNVTESPVGNITMQYFFAKPQAIQNINPVGSLALIGQTRIFTACIKSQEQNVTVSAGSSTTTTCVDPGLWPGLYTLRLDAFYGQNGNNTEEVTGSAYFWYLPVWFLIVAGIVLAILALFIWRTIHNIRNGLRRARPGKKSLARRR